MKQASSKLDWSSALQPRTQALFLASPGYDVEEMRLKGK